MKHFTVTYDAWWEAHWEIDVAKAAPVCRASLDFFGDPIEREDDSDEELVRAFLKFWTRTILMASRNFEPILSYMGRQEGCPPLDGSQGIRFLTCDTWEFDESNMDVTSEEAA